MLDGALCVSLDGQGDLRALSTEFATLVEYQKAMSRLVFTETLASLQQELDNRKDRRGVSHVRGRVSRMPRFLPFQPTCCLMVLVLLLNAWRMLVPTGGAPMVIAVPVLAKYNLRGGFCVELFH